MPTDKNPHRRVLQSIKLAGHLGRTPFIDGEDERNMLLVKECFAKVEDAITAYIGDAWHQLRPDTRAAIRSAVACGDGYGPVVAAWPDMPVDVRDAVLGIVKPFTEKR